MADPLRINGRITLPAAEIDVRTTRASGPGGQHVNKVETAVELRFDVSASEVLTDSDRARIVEALGNRMVDGNSVLVLRSSEHRSQHRNLEAARARLAALLAGALAPRKIRRATKPTKGSQRRRLDAKKKRGDLKKQRRKRDFEG